MPLVVHSLDKFIKKWRRKPLATTGTTPRVLLLPRDRGWNRHWRQPISR
ncbi:MAG: hypothetical protein QXH88_06910 [Sulfolobales archaeon]